VRLDQISWILARIRIGACLQACRTFSNPRIRFWREQGTAAKAALPASSSWQLYGIAEAMPDTNLFTNCATTWILFD
jgi:hypothetical protein